MFCFDCFSYRNGNSININFSTTLKIYRMNQFNKRALLGVFKKKITYEAESLIAENFFKKPCYS